MMELVDVYTYDGSDTILLVLLSERTQQQSISHKRMPSWEEHVAFVRSMPYKAWWLIEVDNAPVGAVYLSRQNEIGVSIFKAHQRKGYGPEAVRQVMAKFPFVRRYVANVNPANEASATMFRRLGFGLVQHTYALEAL
jgi:RimJ/RimL family protein N-acetyltransferase